VALYRAVRVAADLPPVGTAYEREHLDFKVRVHGGRTYDLAKDVAAFANNIGGVILVGAEEANERLVRYLPLTAVDVDLARKAFDDAVRDRCVPPPPVELDVIPHGAEFVLAVNVRPLPDQVVGVKAPVERVPGDKIGDVAFVFPLRVQTGTVFLQPPQLGMVMIPALRRAAISLDLIPAAERSAVHLWYRVGTTGDAYATPRVTLTRIDAEAGIVTFRFEDKATVPHPVSLGLETTDGVQPVQNGTQRSWRVRLFGTLIDPGTGAMFWQPIR
jgi:hypothetical protein